MESVLGRYRNLIILVGVLFLQVLGLAVQVKRNGDAEHTRLIRIWAVDSITPLERVFVRAEDGANNLWHNYFFLRGVRAENRQLKQQIEQMRLEQVRLAEDAAQARRLQSLLGFKEQVIAKTVAAQVIGSGGSDLSRIVYLDKGSESGIGPDMAVITADGIVGKVLEVFPTTSKVLLINDQSSGVGALLDKSRLQGVLRGTATGELSLERVMSDEQVSPGEIVLSSGGDQIFPKGLPVGTVMHVSPGKELFLNIKVKPAADLSRLEEVLVVTEKHERQPVQENAPRVRAADILAQRLPSVPDKPPAPASAAKPQTASAANHAPSYVAGAKPQNDSAQPASIRVGASPDTVPKKTAPLQTVPGNSSPAKTTSANAAQKLNSPAPANPNLQRMNDSAAQNSVPKIAKTIGQAKPAAEAPNQSPASQDAPH